MWLFKSRRLSRKETQIVVAALNIASTQIHRLDDEQQHGWTHGLAAEMIGIAERLNKTLLPSFRRPVQ